MSRLMTAVLAAAACLSWSGAHALETSKTFSLQPEVKVLKCFAANVAKPPTATVTVSRAGQRDHLVLTVHGLKPRLQFDVFTVQRSNLLADGQPDPAFTGSFGLAWYQSDLNADADGNATTSLNSIFIDQIFGFDPDVKLAPPKPLNTFHIGFWFNDPNTAVPCGFDATKPTPFNGEQKAGPAAMISVPAEHTGLGPLCLNPRASKPSGCDN
jgi:hypothetical protein